MPIVSAPVEQSPADLPTAIPGAAPVAETPPASVVRRHAGAIQTVGRRKQAIVRVRLLPGSGKFNLNGKSLEEYFPNKVHQQLIREPFVTLERGESFDVIARLTGGGTTGQAGALRLAITRALVDDDPEIRPTLKKAGFLTRDPRVKERKKYGLKKARKAPQYSKR
ncbi:MAG: 30S ribosomal protein S9 [Mycobacteriales bacterium]